MKTGCQDGTEDKITMGEINAAECVAIPNPSGTPNCVNISSLGRTWAQKHVTVNPFTNTFLKGPGCSLEGRDFSRNQYELTEGVDFSASDNSDRDSTHDSDSDNDFYSGSENDFYRPVWRPAPAAPNATPEERRVVAMSRRRAAIYHISWVRNRLNDLAPERGYLDHIPFPIGSSNWMTAARLQREERELKKEIIQLDREIQDDYAQSRARTRTLRDPGLLAIQRKIASIKDELVDHISRSDLHYTQRARERVFGRERYLESLKQRLRRAEFQQLQYSRL